MIRSAIWASFVVFATFGVHEGAHGLVGAALGYDMIVGLNGARPQSSSGVTFWERDLITAAGPAITLLQGFAAVLLASVWRPAFTIGLAALMMRILAAVASLRNPNDEARLGLSWDVGYWTVHVLVIGALAYLVVLAARSAKPGWTPAMLSVGFIIFGMTLVVSLEKQISTIVIPGF